MLGMMETCGQVHSHGTLWAGYALRDRREHRSYWFSMVSWPCPSCNL